MKPVLTEQELAEIRTRIEAAERETAGEIVPYVVARSDDYEAVVWRGAAAAGALFLILTLLIYLFYDGWSLGWLYTGVGLAIGVVASFFIGTMLVLTTPRFFRLMAGASLMERRVRARANRAFADERIYETANRNGILIFVSVWEHRIEVVADAGIIAQVAASEWETVVSTVADRLKRRELAAALSAGVDACAEILKKGGLGPSDSDDNELPNEAMIGE